MRKTVVSSFTYSIVLLVLLIIIGAGVRLYRLGDMDTRADEVELLIPPIANFGPAENFIRDFQAFKTGRILGLPRMTTSALVKGLGLKTNRQNIRIAYALMGILTIPALFLLGLRLGDRRLAWILAFMGVINPYLIFFSRAAHVYAFPLLFNTLAAAFAGGVIASLRQTQRSRRSDVIWMSVASILACHSHMSSWPFVGLLWGLIFLVLWRQRREPVAREAIRGVGIAFGLWVLAILPWIVMFISALFTAQDSFLPGGWGPVRFRAMWRLPFVMMWGGGMPWGVVTMVLLLAGIVGGLISSRWRMIVATALIIGIIIFCVMSFMMSNAGGLFCLRYYNPLWLVFNLLGGLGVLTLAEWIAARVQAAGWKRLRAGYVAIGLCGVVAAFMALPIYWLLHLPGNPMPYSMINRWMDAHLAKGTLVIVDRWFEPWNEMKYHAPTNVVATFTVPAEPLEVFLKYNWRETVKQFFAKYPDAAFLELTKSYCERPEVGYWDWPHKHFVQHVAFTNEQALALRHAMLVPEEAYYGTDTNRIIVDLYFNTRDDAVNQARAAGTESLVLYGTGWGYVKLWQQLRDFRDWRVLEDKATVDVYNLTQKTNSVTLLIRGMAANGGKRVRFGMLGQADFQNLQLAEWRIERVPLKPGLNQFVLTDALWSVARIPLLVDQVEVLAEEVRDQPEIKQDDGLPELGQGRRPVHRPVLP